MLRRHHSPTRIPRRDRVHEPADHRDRRPGGDRRRPARLVPAPLPLAPGAVRGAAADRGDRPGDPRGAGGQVPPCTRPGDEPLHPLDDAARRRLRPRLVLALRTLGAATLERSARRLGGALPDPAGAADDPRRHDRHRLWAPCRRPRGAAGAPLPLRGGEDAGMGGRAPCGNRHCLRPRRDRRLVPPPSPWRRSAGAEAAHGGARPARTAGRNRRHPVGTGTPRRDRLGPRRGRDLQLADDALDRGLGRAPGAARGSLAG